VIRENVERISGVRNCAARALPGVGGSNPPRAVSKKMLGKLAFPEEKAWAAAVSQETARAQPDF